MWNWIRITALGVIALCSAVAANWARDIAYETQALFIMVVALGQFVWEVRHLDGAPRRAPLEEYQDSVIRAGIIATCFWAIVGFAIGLVLALQLAFPLLNFEFLHGFGSFGRLRPAHTSVVLFAFCGNALIATSFYIVQRTSNARLYGGGLPWVVFWGFQLFIALSAVGYIFGANQTKDYAEAEWIADWLFCGVWLAYIVTYFGTLARRQEPRIFVANWFYLAFMTTIAILHVVNNLAVPVSFFGSKSVPLFGGVQDAMIQSWFSHNALGFLLTTGFMGMLYYLLPKQAGQPIYSYKLAIVHFWTLIFFHIWAGPHPSTVLPDWLATLGMVFSVLLWLPSWAGVTNGVMTLSGAWHKLRTDPILLMIFAAVLFYAFSILEGTIMSFRALNVLSHYTEWSIGHVHAGALGWNGLLTFAALYYLVPRLWRRKALYSTRLVTWHFWLAATGTVIYAASMAAAGIMEGLMWQEVDANGFLVNAFADTVSAKFPMYVARAMGGGLYLIGALLMCYNLWRTAKGTPHKPRGANATS